VHLRGVGVCACGCDTTAKVTPTRTFFHSVTVVLAALPTVRVNAAHERDCLVVSSMKKSERRKYSAVTMVTILMQY